MSPDDSDPTLEAGTRDSSTTLPRAETPFPIAGYTIREVIGRGGMGEIVLAHDPEVGRDVAIKRMRSAHPSPDSLVRFLREAKIQARLDHPAIVPVHELGKDAQGHPYFAMKRLAGKTMTDVLGTPAANQKALLRAFVDICLAIDFAHNRGVIHRDIKPSNIVLGDYGEVYVLDWGVARVIDEVEGVLAEDITTLEGQTQAGAILGTPGYMPPEQLRGLEVTRAADVYALGAILFEILAGQALHPTGSRAIMHTMSQPTAAPSKRAGNVAPELDALCVAALAEDPMARPTARALGDRVQQFLDGDRDVAHRRELAATSLASARAALATDDRKLAMAAAGRALALDPESKDAAALVTQLMLEPPKVLPASLRSQIASVDLTMTLQSARAAAFAFLAFFVFIPVLIWDGIRDVRMIVIMFSAIALLAAFAWRMYRSGKPRIVVALFLNAAFIILFSRLLGVFVVLPAIAVTMTMGLTSQVDLLDRPWLIIVTIAGALVAPLVLEWAGVFGATASFERDVLEVSSGIVTLHGTPTLVMLIASNVVAITVTCLFARQIALTRRDAMHALEVQAWHLRALLPVEPR